MEKTFVFLVQIVYNGVWAFAVNPLLGKRKYYEKAFETWCGISLVKRIVAGLIIGAILGVAVPQFSGIAILGSVFVGALKAVAPLLVFFLVISSLCHSGKSHGGVIRTVIVLYMFSTFLAAVIAVIASMIFPITLTLAEGASDLAAPEGIVEVLSSLLLNMVSNPVQSLVSANYIGVLVWAVLFGIACAGASETTKTMFDEVSNGLAKVVTWIISISPPFGIMGLYSALFLKMVSPSSLSTESCWLSWSAPCCSFIL